MGSVMKSKPSLLVERQDRRVYSEVIGRDNYAELEKMSQHHPKLMAVAIKLSIYISECVKEGPASLLDIILSEALTEWSTRYINEGCIVAYNAYCKSIFKSLVKMYEIRITGRRGFKPFQLSYWDCTRMSVTQWLKDNQIREMQIERVEMDFSMSKREAALIIAPQIFDRHDLTLWGLPEPLEQLPVRIKA